MSLHILTVVFAVVFWNLVLCNVPDELKCRLNAENMAGACAIKSDKCCESYAGHECRLELNQQFSNYAAPQLQFYNDSLIYDPKMQLLCVKGLKVPGGDALRGNEIQGVYLEVDVLNETSIYSRYFSANTIIFPGLVFSESMKTGLFCAEMTMPEDKIMGDGIYFVLKMLPLPPGKDRHAVLYLDNQRKPFLRSKDIPRANILLKNCHKWSEYQEKPQQKKNCTNSELAGYHSSREFATKNEEERPNFWRCAAIGSTLFSIGCVVGHIISKANLLQKLRSLCEKELKQGESNFEPVDERSSSEDPQLKTKDIETPEDPLTGAEKAGNMVALPVEGDTEKQPGESVPMLAVRNRELQVEEV